MAFAQFKLNQSINQSRGIFDTYSYRTEDTIADITNPGYFALSRFVGDADGSFDWRGAIVDCECVDGLFSVRILPDGISSEIAGQQSETFTTVTENYTQDVNDDVIYFDSATPITIDMLPEAEFINQVTLKNLGAGTVTINPAGSETTEVSSLSTAQAVTLGPRAGVGLVSL